jgi:hypothetical protein
VPVAVIVYVVDVVGTTGVEPCGATLPTPGSMSRSVALVDDHASVTVWPEFTDVGEAFSVTVGCVVTGAGAAAGGLEATFFWQPPMNAANAKKLNKSVDFRRLPCCMNCLLGRSRKGIAKNHPE